MIRGSSDKMTPELRRLLLINGYAIVVFSWVLMPAMWVFLFVTFLRMIIDGSSIDGQPVVFAYPRWEGATGILIMLLLAAALFYFVGRFGMRYVATVKAGKRPWPWPSD
jgi:hypothetical protein